jgi:hypothetical protein
LIERATGLSIEMLQHGEKVTGISGLLGRSLTGPNGAVGG